MILNKENTTELIRRLKLGESPDLSEVDLVNSPLVYSLLVCKQAKVGNLLYSWIYEMLKNKATKEELEFFMDIFMIQMKEHIVTWGMPFAEDFNFKATLII